MNYNKVLDSLEPYLSTLAPTRDNFLTLTYLNLPENLISGNLTLQQALHALIVLEVPLYWRGTSYQVVSASWSFQREILEFENSFVKSYGKGSSAVNLLLRGVK